MRAIFSGLNISRPPALLLCYVFINTYYLSYINLSKNELNTYYIYDAVCIFITLAESILGVYQFACVDACIPIEYKCIDTDESYFCRILYYRVLTSRYISYRVVYSILICAGYIYMYIFICIYIYAYECMLLCIHDYMHVFMCAHSMYADFMMLLFLPMVAWLEIT